MTPCVPNQDSTVDCSTTDSSTVDNSTVDSNVLDRLARRRAQTRTRQLRYLRKKQQYENDLNASVGSLQTEVQQLQQHLHQHSESHPCSCPISVTTSTAASVNFLQTAHDLVHCFRGGFATTTSQPWLPCPSPTQEQIRFVQQSTHPDMQHGELRGQNSFLEQWRRYTTFFEALTLHPNSFQLLSHRPGHVLCQVQLVMSLGLVSATFQRVFPHLLHPQHSTLFHRLNSQQIHVPMTLQLQFDALGRVCSYDASPNFVHALRPLLSSYEEVATVLQDAAISPCGHIVSNSSSPDNRLALSFVLSPE